MQSSNVKSELLLTVNVKSEPLYIDTMASPKTQYDNLFKDKKYTNEGKLKILDNLINNTQSTPDPVEYYSYRATANFDMRNWGQTLSDIQFVESKQALNNALLSIKWISTFYSDANKLRESIKNTMGIKLLDDKDHMTIFNSISAQNLDKVFKIKTKVSTTLKRLQN